MYYRANIDMFTNFFDTILILRPEKVALQCRLHWKSYNLYCSIQVWTSN